MRKLPQIPASADRESHIENSVVRHAESLGFIAYKFTSPSRRGVPDHLILYNAGSFFIEFKTEKGKLSAHQEHEIRKLKALNHEVYVISSIIEGIEVVNKYIDYMDKGRDSRTLHQLEQIVSLHVDNIYPEDAEVLEELFEHDSFNSTERAYVERIIEDYDLEISAGMYWE